MAGASGLIGTYLSGHLNEYALLKISRSDMALAIVFLIRNNKSGIFNLTSPGYCTNKEFTKSLGYIIKNPARFILPKIVFRIFYGRGAAVVTGGQAVIPERLIKVGFQFNYQNVDKAKEDIVN